MKKNIKEKREKGCNNQAGDGDARERKGAGEKAR